MDTIQARYSTGRRQLINRAEKQQREISEEIRKLKTERYVGVTKARSIEIKERILELTAKYDAVTRRLRKELQSLEEMRDREIAKKKVGRARWSF